MALPPIDPQQRQKLLLGLLAVVGIAYGAYHYVLAPRNAEVAALETHLESVRLQNQTARALVRDQGTAEVERRLGRYREQLQAVEALIPSAEELPDLLDAISAEGQRTGVQLTLIQPVEAVEEQYYTRRVYDVGVVGTYHAIGQFLTRVASLPRIVTPIDLALTRQAEGTGENPRLEARFSIETYVISEGEGADVETP